MITFLPQFKVGDLITSTYVLDEEDSWMTSNNNLDLTIEIRIDRIYMFRRTYGVVMIKHPFRMGKSKKGGVPWHELKDYKLSVSSVLNHL